MTTADPQQLVILSGKGGTGKTSVAAALAHLAAQTLPLVIADADVDASNLDLVLEPQRLETHDFASGLVAEIDPAACIACGECEAACYFDAIVPGEIYRVDPIACEGCAACRYRCPVEAIRTYEPQVGQWFLSDTAYGPLYHAHLFAGAENSGKLVTLVKQQARLRALDDNRPLILVDGPPGIGCPVISAASGATLALLVVEPTLAGVHDLQRIFAVTRHFGVPAMVLVNKADLSAARTAEITAFCRAESVPLAPSLPYDTIVTEAMVRGLPVTAYAARASVSQALQETWALLKAHLAL
ncbi:MAG TPA: (4Fe-4S)-binding protein [Chloroflexi bacterium]|nr:(4Fe-4S)-binding protein [Chloroflexota bacterium]